VFNLVEGNLSLQQLYNNRSTCVPVCRLQWRHNLKEELAWRPCEFRYRYWHHSKLNC